VGRTVAREAADGHQVRAFGEMVSLLASGSNHMAAIALENLWHELAETYPFSLFCAYAMSDFGSSDHTIPFDRICAHHTCVIPAESYTPVDSPEDRMGEIARLQQKARALEAEIAHGKEIELTLARRER